MIHPSATMAFRFGLFLFFAHALVACGSSQSRPQEREEKFVPEKNQQSARELQGSQQQMMTDLNLTPAEQAAARHDARTLPAENPKYSKEDEEK